MPTATPFCGRGSTTLPLSWTSPAIAEAGFEAGLDVLGYTDRANLLFNCGILESLSRRAPEESADYIRAAKAVQRLTGPHEMGELFKVIALGRGITQPLIGFRRDRLHRFEDRATRQTERPGRTAPLPHPLLPWNGKPRSGRHPHRGDKMPLGRRHQDFLQARASSGQELAFSTSSL